MRLSTGNPMVRVLATTLAFEVVVFALAIPGMVLVSGVPVVAASVAGGLACLLALAAAATLRRGPGYPLGWLTQAAGVALGVLTPSMFVMGSIFAALWVTCFVLGRRLDAR